MAHFQDTTARPHSYLLCRDGKLLVRALLLSMIALLSGIGAVQAQETDGRALLLKTLTLYQKFNSYSGQANVDTIMVDSTGQTIKHIGSSSVMKLQRPNKIYIFFQTPIGSRSIYSDGANFSVFDPTPNQYLTVPTAPNTEGLLQLLLTRADVAAGLDPLYFLTQKTLPAELVNVKIKASTTFNGHQVYVITGTTNVKPVVMKSGNTITTIPTSYWTWWIDRTSSLLYKVETRTPNIIKPVSFGNGATRTVKNVKGTLIMRHTVTEVKPDANLKADEFVFNKPKTATAKVTAQDLLNKKGK
ncbi:MAG: putative periplasmic protein [Chthonomonadales bacterium]|nr:putative periplasmic protein [Chthonomonadales bacterium]